MLDFHLFRPVIFGFEAKPIFHLTIKLSAYHRVLNDYFRQSCFILLNFFILWISILCYCLLIYVCLHPSWVIFIFIQHPNDWAARSIPRWFLIFIFFTISSITVVFSLIWIGILTNFIILFGLSVIIFACLFLRFELDFKAIS
jgi:hypothetical protein